MAQITIRLVISILWLALVAPVWVTGDAHATWIIQAADVRPTYNTASTRTLRIDKRTNTPHTAFGGDYLYHGYFDGTQWNIETIDKSPNVGSYASLALDSNGKLHVSYYDSTNGELRYATNALGSWMAIVLDTGGVGIFNGIAVDTNGRVHISYFDSTNRALKYATNVSGSWDVTTLDTGLATNGYTAIDVDSANRVHIVYASSASLKYATNSSGMWVLQTAATGGLFSFPSLVLDPAGKGHISVKPNNGSLLYITNASGGWVATPVASDPNRYFGGGTSIDLDSAGVLHITWFGLFNGNAVYHASNPGGTWSWSQVTTGASWFAGDFSSVAADRDNNIHITHYSTDTYNFKYTTNASGAWTTSNMSVAGFAGENSAIAVDSNSRAHIAYKDRDSSSRLKITSNTAGWSPRVVDQNPPAAISIAVDTGNNEHVVYSANGSLLYGTNSGGGWSTQIIDVLWCDYSSLAIDSSGHMHVGYQDTGNSSLKYATNASGSWVWETVETQSGVNLGPFASIAVDATNAVHISYLDATNGDLKYATKPSGGSWSITSIDSANNIGSSTSIAVDASRYVHIGYYDQTNLDLKYATNSSGSWVTSTIDSTGDVGSYNSLKVDASGRIHIAYYDYTNGDLKYATYSGSSWAISVVDSIGSVGMYCSLAVDKNRRVHISYYDASSRDLKYATNAAIDITPPGGMISVSSGAEFVNSPAVSLGLACTDLQSSCISMQFSNDGTYWNPPLAFASTAAWGLSPGNGLKTIYGRFMDSWGNWSNAAITSVMLDATPPTGTVSINNGAALSTSPFVTLTLSCGDTGGSGCAQFQLSNDGVTWGLPTNNSAYPATSSWQLTSGEGNNNVYVRYLDAAGNPSNPAIASITLDTVKPSGTVMINGGTVYATAKDVTLSVSCSDGSGSGCSMMRFSNNGTSWSTAVAFATGYPWDLTNAAYGGTPSDGSKSVYVQFQDTAGNWSSAIISAGIILDATKPSGTLNINSGAVYTTAKDVTLTLTCSDGSGSGCSQMRFSNNGSSWSDAVAFATGYPWDLTNAAYGGTPVDSAKTVYVQFQDVAGTWSSAAISGGILLDSSAPVTSVSSPASTLNLSGATDVYLSCNDGSGIGCAGTWYTTDGSTPTEASTPYSAGTPIPFSGLNSPVQLTFFSVDTLGNAESPKTVTVSFVAGFTTLSLDVPPTLLQNGLLEVSGKLTRYPDSVAVPNSGMDLSGLPVVLTITGPAGSPCAAGCSVTETIDAQGFPHPIVTYSSLGHYKVERINRFSFPGTYTITAHFAGTGLHSAADSSDEPILVGASAGYAVIVEGKVSTDEGLMSHNKTTNRIYATLKERGFEDDNIIYFNYGFGMVPGVDGVPDKADIQYTIETWAKERMNGAPAPLYVIFVDHGNDNTFYIYPATITPTELNGWLTAMEAGLIDAAKLQKRVLILGACYSGSFLEELKQAPVPGLNAGRIVVASAAADEQSYKGPNEPDGIRSGEFFIEELFKSLKKGSSLKAAFVDAAGQTRAFTSQGGNSSNTLNSYNDSAVQHPLLDDNGDGVGSNTLADGIGDGVESAAVYLGVGVTNASLGPADLKSVTPTRYLAYTEEQSLLEAEAFSNAAVSSAWFEVKAPTVYLQGIPNNTGQLDLVMPRWAMTLNGARWQATYGSNPSKPTEKFATPGKYELFYFTKSKNAEISEMRRSVVYKNYQDNAAPSPFDLLAPADTSQVRTEFNMVWQPSSDPDGLSYTVQIASDGSSDTAFTNSIVFQKEEIVTSWYSVDASAALNDGVTYYWRVIAVDGFGEKRASSHVWNFQTNNTNAFPVKIKGQVLTTLGGAVSGATINIRNMANALVAQFGSLTDGTYLATVQPDTYKLSAQAPGFAANNEVTVAASGVLTTAGALQVLDIANPAVSEFTLPVTSTSAAVTFLSLAATDNVAVTEYCVSESNSSAGCVWGPKPAQHTFTGLTPGVASPRTLYAFARDGVGNLSTTTLISQATVTITIPPTLLVSVSGSGRVYQSTSGIDCTSGNPATPGCNATAEPGTPFTLVADAASWRYLFASWSGAYCNGSTSLTCSFNLDGDASITATFTPNYQARYWKTATAEWLQYPSLQDALNAAETGSTVQAMAYLFQEALLFDRADMEVTVDGGREANFGTTIGNYTAVKGTLTVKNGTLKIKGPTAVKP